jgi:multidrug efflux pump subunit AcrA (membrane-fusion protein)
MLLKLLMPAHHRIVEGGVIVKWHKAEGDWVNYGDDLLDLRVQEGLVSRLDDEGWSENQVRALIRAQRDLGHVTDQDLMAGGQASAESCRKVAVDFLVRVSASDVGKLGQLCAREGDRLRTGELLAVLTTEEGEPCPGAGPDLEGASAFRTVVNPLVPEDAG